MTPGSCALLRQVGLLAWLYGSAKRRGPFLVVSPLSTIPNWLREVGPPASRPEQSGSPARCAFARFLDPSRRCAAAGGGVD